MTVYFACVTNYNVFVSYILLKTKYKGKDFKKVMLINDGIDSVLSIAKNIDNSGLWDEVILINQRDKTAEQIKDQIKQLDLKNNDILHFFTFGMQYSCLLFNMFPTEAKIILTDEGYASYMVLEFYNNWKRIVGISEDVIDFNRINETWLFDTSLSTNSLAKPSVNIGIQSYINNLEFQLDCCNDLKKIYNLDNTLQTDWNIIFFDQYPSSIGQISLEAEKHILKNVYEVTKDFNLLVKQHPSESSKDKYNGLPFKFMENRGCPWEAIYTNELFRERKTGKKVFITYNSTSVFNNKVIFKEYDDDSYIILLYKILDRYSLESSNKEFINQYTSVYGSRNLYIPESFSELSNILHTIMGSTKAQEKSCRQLELEKNDELNWLRKEYKRLWKTAPRVENLSTLFFNSGEGVTQSVIKSIVTDTTQFDFTFNVPEQLGNNLVQVQWYAVRGRLVKIKLESVSYLNDKDEAHEIDMSTIIHYGQIDPQGYISFESFDPTFFIPFQHHVKQVLIRGQWNFVDNYPDTILVANQMAQNLADRLDIALQECSLLKSRLPTITQQNIDAQQECSLLESKLSDSLKQNVNLQQKCAILESKLSNITQQNIDERQVCSLLESQLSGSILQIEDLQQKYEYQVLVSNTYQNSTFWKMTKPFRLAVDVMKKIIKALK